VRAVLLARVSEHERKHRKNDGESKQNQNPESQLIALRRVAAANGWEIVREVSLRMSAWDDREAALVRQEALKAVRETNAEILAVWSLDRIYRGEPIGLFSFLRDLQQHEGAAFYCSQEGALSTASMPPLFRDLVLHLFAILANMESERRSERVLAARDRKVAHAEAGGGRAIWGRGSIPTPKDIERILFLRRGGWTLQEIAERTEFSIGTVHKVVHGNHFRRGPDEGPESPARTRGQTEG